MARKKDLEKNRDSIDGNTFNQEFDNLKFIKEYKEWENHVKGISGESIGVKNIPTLFDFLIVHIIDDNVRAGSINRKRGNIGKGGIEALSAISEILEEKRLDKIDIINIKNLAKNLREYKDSDDLNPRLIRFTEKIAGKERDLYGHYRTENYVKGRQDGLGAVPSGWYAGAGNPPSWALFGGNSAYASPRGLLEILDDITDELDEQGKGGVNINNLEIVNIKGKNIVDKLSGIASIENYFDKAIKNESFWKGGRLITRKVMQDFNAQRFALTKKGREQIIIRELSGIGNEKESRAGVIKDVGFKSTALPIIDLIGAALNRAGTNKAPDGYRAFQTERRTGFDYRKTAREAFGEDTGKYKPDAKVISKMWKDYLRRINFGD